MKLLFDYYDICIIFLYNILLSWGSANCFIRLFLVDVSLGIFWHRSSFAVVVTAFIATILFARMALSLWHGQWGHGIDCMSISLVLRPVWKGYVYPTHLGLPEPGTLAPWFCRARGADLGRVSGDINRTVFFLFWLKKKKKKINNSYTDVDHGPDTKLSGRSFVDRPTVYFLLQSTFICRKIEKNGTSPVIMDFQASNEFWNNNNKIDKLARHRIYIDENSIHWYHVVDI